MHLMFLIHCRGYDLVQFLHITPAFATLMFSMQEKPIPVFKLLQTNIKLLSSLFGLVVCVSVLHSFCKTYEFTLWLPPSSSNLIFLEFSFSFCFSFSSFSFTSRIVASYTFSLVFYRSGNLS